MSLQYILDGNNIINHPSFTSCNRKIQDSRTSLLEYIAIKKLCGSPRNKIIVVFDGHPYSVNLRQINPGMSIIFSKDVSADEKIKNILEKNPNPKNTVVVSDDKEIIFFVRSFGAIPLPVEEFINPGITQRAKKLQKTEEEFIKPELTYTQMEKINQELRKAWLK
jgi:predicted RNA-binding protein with PIN domain